MSRADFCAVFCRVLGPLTVRSALGTAPVVPGRPIALRTADRGTRDWGCRMSCRPQDGGQRLQREAGRGLGIARSAGKITQWSPGAAQSAAGDRRVESRVDFRPRADGSGWQRAQRSPSVTRPVTNEECFKQDDYQMETKYR